MALSLFRVTVVTKSDAPFNVLPAVAIEIKDTLSSGASGPTSSIFSDQAGTIPITQPGAVTDAFGQFEFYAANDNYNAEFDNNGTPIVKTITPVFNPELKLVAFATVAAMKAACPPPGKLVSTVNYRSTPLGGGATYLSKTAAQATTDGDVIDGFANHTLASGDVAIIQGDDNLNVKQVGFTVDIKGSFRWSNTVIQNTHDGGMTLDPSIPFYTVGNETSVDLWYNGDPSHTGAGVLLRNIRHTVTDEDYSVIASPAFVFNEGFVNRKAYETMLRNTSQNDFTFVAKTNPTFIWGSVHPLRNDMTIRHLAGCDIRGRYSDPEEPATAQAGHMFGFVEYNDPFPGTDFTVVGTTTNVNYILDGVASTIFDADHTALHNNNVIAFFDHEDCSVTGTGGIAASDHNGVAFDGLGINSKVDLAFIKNYDDRAVTMKGTPGVEDSAEINIRKLSGATRDGSVSESILVQDLDYAKVTVGDAVLNLSSLGTFVNAIGCRLVDINTGYLENAVFWCALSETEQININGGRYKNVTFIARRGGTAPATIPLKKVRIRDVECVDSLDTTIYISQISPNEGTWDEFEVRDCDFSAATGTFTPYNALVSLSKPDLFTFRNNKAPKTSEIGTHDGAANASVLTDTTQAWAVNEHVGLTLNNITDGSTTTITANTATTITGVLAGGAENDWDTGDHYRVVGWVPDPNIFNIMHDQPNLPAGGGTTFVYDINGANGDNPYSIMDINLTNVGTSFRIPLQPINLRDLLITAAQYRYETESVTGDRLAISTNRVGTVVTFTLVVTGGTGGISSFSLRN